MPVGLVIMKWDDRVGTEILATHPEEISITDKTLMQVYSTHEYTGEAGMVSLMVGSLNIASYFSGPEKSLYVILLLNLDEDPDAYEGGLVDISGIVLQNLDDDAYLRMVPTLFQRLSVYPHLNDEQRLAITYQDEIKRMIINRLRDEGTVSKSELTVWLKDRYRRGFVDLEGVLIELIKRELIKEASVKGMPSELIFLTNDLLISRVPPVKVLKAPDQVGLPTALVQDYKAECRKYFQTYKPSEQDNLRLIDIFVDPQVYETLKLLRTAIVTRNDLEKLKKKGVEDLDVVLKKLWENQMIQVFQDASGNEYYALLTDFYMNRLFPKHMLIKIKDAYDHKSKADQVLVEYCNVLEDSYQALKHPVKAEEE